MNLGLDFDGVIADCSQLKTKGAKKLYGVDIPPHLFKKELVLANGWLTEIQYRNLQLAIYSTREHGLNMSLVPGAKESIVQLANQGHRVVVITSRGEEETAIADEFCCMQNVYLDFISTGYGASKLDAVQSCSLDIYIDDDLDKLEPLVNVVPHLFLFHWGYNEHLDNSSIAERVYSWAHLYQKLQSIDL